MAGGVQMKRLEQQAKKDKLDAANAKKRRTQLESEAAGAAKKLQFERDRDAAQYYEKSNVATSNRQQRSRNEVEVPHSGSGSARASASALTRSGSAPGKENIAPGIEEPEYPCWRRGVEVAGGTRSTGGSALVVAGDVDERFALAPGRSSETSLERAMAVVSLIGWAKDCDPYPTPDLLIRSRAIIEGMPEYEVDGSPSDPKAFLRAANYNYLRHWHTKKMSSTSGEFAGIKGIQGIFAQHAHFNLELCKTDAQTAEMKAKGEELRKDGTWHTDDSGNPFSSEIFTVICNNVWRTEGCLITAKQLVWAVVVVEKMLQDKKLSIDRDVNAMLLDTVGTEVQKILMAARKAKRTLGMTLRRVDQSIAFT